MDSHRGLKEARTGIEPNRMRLFREADKNFRRKPHSKQRWKYIRHAGKRVRNSFVWKRVH